MKLELKNYPYVNLSIGFAIVLLLMLAMSFVGLTRMAALNWHMQEIVKDRNVKTDLAQVMKNAQAMAAAFVEKGYKIISGGTDNHLMLIDLRSKGVTGKQAEEALVRADITVNKNMVPFDTASPMVTSGIRIGTAAMTTRGFTEADFRRTVEWIDALVMDVENEELINETRKEVNRFMAGFALYEMASMSV